MTQFDRHKILIWIRSQFSIITYELFLFSKMVVSVFTEKRT